MDSQSEGRRRAAWVAKAPGAPLYVVEAKVAPDAGDPTARSLVIHSLEVGSAGDPVRGSGFERIGPVNGELPDPAALNPALHEACLPPGRAGGELTRFEPIDTQDASAITWSDLLTTSEEHDAALVKALAMLPPECVDEPFEANFPEGWAPDEASRRTSDLYFERSVLDELTDAMYGDLMLSAQALETRAYEASSAYADAYAGREHAEGGPEHDECRAEAFSAISHELSGARREARYGRKVDADIGAFESHARACGMGRVASMISALGADLVVASEANALWQRSNDMTRESVRAQVAHGSPWEGLREGDGTPASSPSVEDVIESAWARSVIASDAPARAGSDEPGR